MNILSTESKADRVISKLLEKQAAEIPNELWLVDDENSYTFLQADMLSNKIARYFIDHGLKKGDVVAMLQAPSAASIVFAMGIFKAGGILSPICFDYRGKELTDAITESTARLLAVDCIAGEALASIKIPDGIRLVFCTDPCGVARKDDLVMLSENVLGYSSAPLDVEGLPDDPVILLRTSGTTGKSKWVLHSNASMLGVKCFTVQKDYEDGDVTYMCFINTHTAFWGVLTDTVVSGTTMAIDRYFSASEFWNRVRHFNASRVVLTGALHTYVWQQPPMESDRDNRVRLAQFTPIKAEMVPKFKERYGFKVMTVGYGCTETGMVSRGEDMDWPGADTCLGDVFPAIELALRDEDDCDVPKGEAGEICFRPESPDMFMIGYLNNDAETSKKIVDGWYHTGDMGILVDGRLHFNGRAKDCVRHKGENISLYEVEALAMQYPGIKELAAYGVKAEDAVSEDVVAIALIPEDKEEFSAKGLADFIYENGPHYFVPEYITVVDTLPRNKTGRVMKRELTDAFDKHKAWVKPAHGYVRRKAEGYVKR